MTDGYKKNLITAYQAYCDFYQIQLKRPKYHQEAKRITLPTREKLMMLIAQAPNALSTRLQMSMETGLRPVELCRLRVKDIDIDHKTVNPTTAKNGNPRVVPMSPNLVAKIQERITRKGLKPNDKLFGEMDADHYGSKYRVWRNKLAEKLKDPTIHQIRLYDFRHYFCTKKLYDLNNPYTVMVLMGHKQLKTTQIYMHYIPMETDPEWTVESTQDQRRADELIAKNFEYVLTTPDGHMKFRKRK